MSIITTKEQKEERLALCNACQHKVVRFGYEVCGKCNCPLGGKTSLTGAKCPEGKWPILAP